MLSHIPKTVKRTVLSMQDLPSLTEIFTWPLGRHPTLTTATRHPFNGIEMAGARLGQSSRRLRHRQIYGAKAQPKAGPEDCKQCIFLCYVIHFFNFIPQSQDIAAPS